MRFHMKVRVEDKDEIKLIPMELSLPLKISTDLMQEAVTQQWKKVYKMLLDWSASWVWFSGPSFFKSTSSRISFVLSLWGFQEVSLFALHVDLQACHFWWTHRCVYAGRRFPKCKNTAVAHLYLFFFICACFFFHFHNFFSSTLWFRSKM